MSFIPTAEDFDIRDTSTIASWPAATKRLRDLFERLSDQQGRYLICKLAKIIGNRYRGLEVRVKHLPSPSKRAKETLAYHANDPDPKVKLLILHGGRGGFYKNKVLIGWYNTNKKEIFYKQWISPSDVVFQKTSPRHLQMWLDCIWAVISMAEFRLRGPGYTNLNYVRDEDSEMLHICNEKGEPIVTWDFFSFLQICLIHRIK